MSGTPVTVTNAGLDLLRDGLSGAASNTAITYVAIGSGLTTFTSGLTSGSPYTSLPVAALPSAVVTGQSLTIVNAAGQSQAVVVAAPGAAISATAIPVTSFTASFTYASGDGVVRTSAATDTALDVETYRAALSGYANGGSVGEGLFTLYLSPTAGIGQIQEVGWYGGASASATPGSGVLLARVLYSHNHTALESINSVLDSVFSA